MFCALLLCSAATLPEPYHSIKDLPFDDHGWFHNQDQLYISLNSQEVTTVIEVGSWLGSSTRFIARNIPENGVVYAIDHWQGSSNEDVHMQDPRLPQLYHLFLSNVKQAGLAKKIVPVRMSSSEAASALNVMADLIYLDASHDTESVYKDIMLWLPHVKEGGILCGDDWWWDSVKAAVNMAADELNLGVYSSGNFWKFVPKQN